MIDFDDLDSAEAESGLAVEEDAGGRRDGCDQQLCAAAEPRLEHLPPAAARCCQERSRPVVAAPVSCGRSRRRSLPGLFYGLPLPWSPGSLKALGADWLTQAFHAAGTLPKACEVVAIKDIRCLGFRSRARQVLLEVEYSRDVTETFHRHLLVKLPRFDPSGADGVRDQSRNADTSPTDHFVEINFYRLFEAVSPFCMPRFYFGDVSDQSENFILITEWVPVSSGRLDVTEAQLCFLRGRHGSHLASSPSDGGLFMSPKRKEWETWALRPVDRGRGHYVQASSGGWLMTSSEGEQSMGVSPSRDERARWTLCPAPGGGGHYFLKGRHQTYLASLNDGAQTIYMSPNAKEWEMWRLIPIESTEARPGGRARHLDLQRADYETFHALVARFARLAGMQRSGVLGAPDLLYGGTVQSEPAPAGLIDVERPAAWTDREFMDEAGAAQDFICNAGEALFPPGVVTSQSMQRYRATLVTTRSNLAEIRHWMGAAEEYQTLGLDFLDVDSAFARGGVGGEEQGLRHWDGLSRGPLGSKLWRLFGFARLDVIQNHLLNLLETFISTYHRSGGPLLDSEMLLNQFLLALCLESVQLLKLVPEFYRCVPREEWAGIANLWDSRIAAHQTSRGSLWLCLKSFVNVFLVLEHFDIKAVLHRVLPLCVLSCAFGSGRLQAFQVSADGGAEIWAEAAGTGPRVSLLPGGCWVITEQYPVPQARTDGAGAVVRMRYPVPGAWVAFERLEAAPAAAPLIAALEAGTTYEHTFENPKDFMPYFHMCFLGLMYTIRRQYTGSNSGGMSEISTSMLQSRFAMYFGGVMGVTDTGRIVRGSFLAQRRCCSWWPPDYEDWAHHSFMAFGDGSIADITADQFDDVPQLWWPADRTRYTFDFQKADAANRLRRDGVGLQSWTRLCEQEDAAEGKTRYPWWTIEWHTTMRLPPRAGAVLRHNEPVQLPPVARRVDVGGDRPAVGFRRLTAEHELGVWLVEDLFRAEEVERLVRCCEARRGFQPSLTKNAAGQVVSDSRRTSSTCPIFWPHLCEGIMDEMREVWGGPSASEELSAADEAAALCAGALEVDVTRIEPLQMVKYTPGQHYLPHLDAHQEPERLSSFCGEQRLQTLLVFMSDVPAADGGGHLHFPLLGLRILPRAGQAVLWSNVKPGGREPDPNSLHEGVAPLTSGKVAMNVWIVDRPLSAASIASGRGGRSCAGGGRSGAGLRRGGPR